MNLSDLDREAIGRFNDQCANMARRWRRIVDRMELRSWDRSCPAYKMAVAIRDTALAMALLTHTARDRFRDRAFEGSKKRSMSSRGLIQKRDDAECGLD